MPWTDFKAKAVAGIAVACLTTISAFADDWPQFRGPNCSGIASSNQSLPLEFSATKNVAWSVELGDGIGSPVVAAGRVFVSAMAGDELVRVQCLRCRHGQ